MGELSAGVALGVSLLLALVGVVWIVARHPRLSAYTPKIDAPRSIASLEPITLGGVRQWILLRGHDVSNPVLLWLHGGPGAPIMPAAGLLSPELERAFVVVHWDQRGAGKSFDSALPAEALRLERFVADAIELTEHLLARFGTRKVILLGHSWGTALGVLAAARRPELFSAYVGMGQVVDNPREEEIGLRFVLEQARERGDERALRELSPLRPPYLDDPKQVLVQRKWLARYGGAFRHGRSLSILPDFDLAWIRAALRSPEYSLLDLIRYQRGFERSRWTLFREFKQLRLDESVPRLEVPVYLLVGRYDYNTPFELVEEYFRKLDAPRGKHLIWFEDSAHSPCLEEPERFAEVMISQVRWEASSPP